MQTLKSVRYVGRVEKAAIMTLLLLSSRPGIGKYVLFVKVLPEPGPGLSPGRSRPGSEPGSALSRARD